MLRADHSQETHMRGVFCEVTAQSSPQTRGPRNTEKHSARQCGEGDEVGGIWAPQGSQTA